MVQVYPRERKFSTPVWGLFFRFCPPTIHPSLSPPTVGFLLWVGFVLARFPSTLSPRDGALFEIMPSSPERSPVQFFFADTLGFSALGPPPYGQTRRMNVSASPLRVSSPPHLLCGLILSPYFAIHRLEACHTFWHSPSPIPLFAPHL